jgi:hypothetical protein
MDRSRRAQLRSIWDSLPINERLDLLVELGGTVGMTVVRRKSDMPNRAKGKPASRIVQTAKKAGLSVSRSWSKKYAERKRNWLRQLIAEKDREMQRREQLGLC